MIKIEMTATPLQATVEIIYNGKHYKQTLIRTPTGAKSEGVNLYETEIPELICDVIGTNLPFCLMTALEKQINKLSKNPLSIQFDALDGKFNNKAC